MRLVRNGDEGRGTAQDAVLTATFGEGLDFHQTNAAKITGLPLDQVNRRATRSCKACSLWLDIRDVRERAGRCSMECLSDRNERG
jgi:hypothetical protein